MNTKLQTLLCLCGWHEQALDPTYIRADAGNGHLQDLANSLDIAARRPLAHRRAELEAARDEAAALGWPPPHDWRAEMAALVAFRERNTPSRVDDGSLGGHDPRE